MWYKRTIPLLLVLIAGLVGFVHDYIPHPGANALREEVTNWIRIVVGFSLFIGAYSLLHMHVGRIRRRQSGWAYSIFVFIGASVTIFLGLWAEGKGPLVDPELGVLNSLEWCYLYILVPCSATIFSILAFFIASAAFRTFRARNLSAAMLLIAAVIVMFGRVPISERVGEFLFGESQVFPQAMKIIMEFPNKAAKRGIMFGVSLGAISQSLRILFGIERSYMGGGD